MELEKKKIVQSSEVDILQKEGKVAFTTEEIYQYSRPDSVHISNYARLSWKTTAWANKTTK